MSNSLLIQTPGSGQTKSGAKQTTTGLQEEVEILNVVYKFLGCIRYIILLSPRWRPGPPHPRSRCQTYPFRLAHLHG